MLSMDAGAFAPMNYNYPNSQSSLGVAGLGYASRGKASNIRRISVPAPQNLPVNDSDSATIQTPRSSTRAQLLSGLRTAPKTPTPYTPSPQEQSMVSPFGGLDNSRYANNIRGNGNNLPQKTVRGLGFPGGRNSITQQPTSQPFQQRSSPPQQQPALAMGGQQMYQQLPTPPSSSPQVGNEYDNESKVYADLLAQNIYLAQQQQILQQQLRNVHQAQQLQQVQQQFQNISLQSPVSNNFQNSSMNPAMYMQNTNNVQGAGYYSMFNPLTGQYNYYLAQPQQTFVQPAQQQQPQQQQVAKAEETQVEERKNSFRRSPSPPKQTEKGPSPPPFRRAHKKITSLALGLNNDTIIEEAPKSALPRIPVPSTPMNSTFGGKGDHPLRQPRGPPNFEEIAAKPTTKHEGSKNFATRQRRRAVFKLVHAGLERRGARSTGSNGGSMTPVSENEASLNFEDSDSVTSSQSGRHSSQSMHGDGDYSASSLSGDEANVTVTKPVQQKKESSGLRAPRLVFGSSEKRKSAMF